MGKSMRAVGMEPRRFLVFKTHRSRAESESNSDLEGCLIALKKKNILEVRGHYCGGDVVPRIFFFSLRINPSTSGWQFMPITEIAVQHLHKPTMCRLN